MKLKPVSYGDIIGYGYGEGGLLVAVVLVESASLENIHGQERVTQINNSDCLPCIIASPDYLNHFRNGRQPTKHLVSEFISAHSDKHWPRIQRNIRYLSK